MTIRTAVLFCLASLLAATPVLAQDKANLVTMELKTGRVTIALRPDLAPKHVERFRQLTRAKFYDGLKFHRVIAGFMAQTGDPTGTGTGGSAEPDLKAEFTSQPFERGTLGAARTGDPDSANSQFFICLEAAPHLNGKYTAFGQVIEGMEHVDKLKRGAAGSGTVVAPDTIVSMRLTGSKS